MDAFDLAEQRLLAGRVAAPDMAAAIRALPEGITQTADGITVNNNFQGNTVASELPPTSAPRPGPIPTITNQGLRLGGDAFDVAEIRLKLRAAMDRGDNLVNLLRRATELGVPDDQPPAPEEFRLKDTALVNGVELTREQWQRAREDFQRNYPQSALPMELQHFGTELLQHEADALVAMDNAEQARAQRYRKEGWDNPIYHDPDQLAVARQRFAELYPGQAMPENLKATQEEQAQAKLSGFVQELRGRLPPEAANLTDAQVLERFGPHIEQLAQKEPRIRSMLGEILAAYGRGWTQTASTLLGGGAGLLATGMGKVAGEASAITRALRTAEANFQDYYATRGSQSLMLASSDDVTEFAPGNPRWWASATAENAPNFIVSMGTGGAALKAAQSLQLSGRAARLLANLTAFGTAGTMEAGAAYNQIKAALLAKGHSEQEASRTAAISAVPVGIVNGLLELVPFNEIIVADRRLMQRLYGTAHRVLNAAGKEGSTEALQEIVGMIGEKAAGVGDFDEKEYWERLLASGLIGAVLGGVATGGEAAAEGLARRAAYGQALQRRARRLREARRIESRGKLAQAAALVQLPGAQDILDAAPITTETSESIANDQPATPPQRSAQLARAIELLDQYAPRDAQGQRRFLMPALEQIRDAQSELRRFIEEATGQVEPTLPAIVQQRQLLDRVQRLDRMHMDELAAIKRSRQARREGTAAPAGIEGRKLPEAPGDLGEPAWRPKLSSITAAKARATARGLVSEGVTLGKLQQVPTIHILDSGEPDAANVRLWMKKMAPGPDSQADAVPPVVVRRLTNGGYQVLDGADQLTAAQFHGFAQVPVIVARGAAEPMRAAPPKPRPVTGEAPRSLVGKDKSAYKRALQAAVKGGEIIHGTDARNLPFIARQGLQPSPLSATVDAELAPEGGFSDQTPSTAITYAVGRARELPVTLVLDPRTNRGTPAAGLINHVAAASEGHSYVAAADIQAVIFPDGTRLPLAQAVQHYQRLREQLQNRLGQRAETQSTETDAEEPQTPQTEREETNEEETADEEDEEVEETDEEEDEKAQREKDREILARLPPLKEKDLDSIFTRRKAIYLLLTEGADAAELSDEAGAGLWQEYHDLELAADELLGDEDRFGLEKEEHKLDSRIGSATQIQTTDAPVSAHYAVVESAELIPSHNPWTFRPNPKYPPDVQERDYQHAKEEQQKVNQNALHLNAQYLLTDNPDPVNGPPMVLANGLVMGGNGRTMSIQQVYGTSGPLNPPAVSLRRQTIEAAARFGIDAGAVQAMQRPVLVRLIDERTDDPARQRELVRLLQKGRTAELSGALDAASRARILMDNPESLSRLESILEDADSVREVMAQASKTAGIRDWLVGSGVFTRQETARYIHPDTGMFVEDGKMLVERILQAVLVPDVGLFDNLPAATANKITGNLYALVYPKAKGPAWDIAPFIQEALRAWYRWRASQAPLEAWLRGEDAGGQQLMVPDPIIEPGHERSALLLRRLVSDNSVGWRERVRAYLTHARADEGGQNTFGFATHTKADPNRAWREAFEAQEPRDLHGNPLTLGKTEKKGGGLFGGGPEKYYQALDELRAILADPEGMSTVTRGVLRLPRRRRLGGGPLFMSTMSTGGRKVNPGQLLRSPELAERIMRVATFHLEQQAEAGEAMLPRWAAALQGDLASIFRDLNYELEESGWADLLEQLWETMAADEDVKGALGELPPFDINAVEGGKRGPGKEGDSGSAPPWLPIEQRDDYQAAVNSDRVSPYVPLEPTREGHHHPRLLVESKALSGIGRGSLEGYEPDVRAVGEISDAQRDQVRQVGWRIHLRSAGALIADDVGVGKSRIIGGIIADQLYRDRAGLAGKRRILVLTKNRQNLADLISTFTREMARTFQPLLEQGLQLRSAAELEQAQVAGAGGHQVLLLDAYNFTRYVQALQTWEPDLVLVDEAHLFSNLAGDTARAQALEGMHTDLLPKGTHFAYLTATPASDIAHLQFMYGLGLWQPKDLVEQQHRGQTFDQWLHAATGVSKSGGFRASVATHIIEQLMRELKMDGAYASLDFWRGGFVFNMAQAPITPQQVRLYDTAANALNRAIRLYASARPRVNHGKWPGNRPNADLGQLSAPPRPDGQAIFFIKRLLVEFRLPKAIEEAKSALSRGEQVVFKILGVSDTHLTGQSGNLGAVFDSIPAWTARKNAKGQIVRWEPIPGVAEEVELLRGMVAEVKPTSQSPLAALLREFGPGNVAAIVGATPQQARIQQNADFQAGKRRVAIISSAGESGINLQDLGTGKRHMIVLDLDWDSKNFKQTLGRIDRTGQVSTPSATTIYLPVAGERKFQATIAARMKSLGAISKGQEDAGNTDALNDFDMESSTWHRAINEVARALPAEDKSRLLHGQKLAEDELSWRDFQNDLMMLPVAKANEIYEKAYARWQELEEEDRAAVGDRIARRNRGLIRQTTVLCEGEHPLEIHAVENVNGEAYGIVSGKLLTRPEKAANFAAIQAAARSHNRSLTTMFITMQQGDRIVSGLYVPRSRIEAIKALFGKASPKHLGGSTALSDAILDKLPPRPALLATMPALPPALLARKHQVLARKHDPRPISRAQILRYIVDHFHQAIAVGKQARFRRGGGGGVLGFYWKRAIRLKVANQIAVTAHELGHALDDLFTGLKPPDTFDAELVPLGNRTSRPSYSKPERRREGVAEWFRLYLIDPDVAAQQAPLYTAWFERKAAMDFPEVWKAVKQLQGLYYQYLAQDEVEKLEAHIDFDDDGPSLRSGLAHEPLGQYLYRHLFDDRAPLDWMRKALAGPDPMNPADKTPKAAYLPDRFAEDAYVLARLNAGNREMVRGWVKYGVRDRDGRKMAQGLEQVLGRHGIVGGSTLRRFEAYLVARRALELYEQEKAGMRKLREVVDEFGGPLGITPEQAQATVDRYESPAFAAAAQGVYAWNHAALRHYLRSSGSFAEDQIERIIALNQDYVPFHRVLDEQQTPAGTGPSLVDKARVFFRIFGSGRRIKRPLATMIRNMARMVENVEANRAALQAFQMLRRHPRGHQWADPVARPIRPVSGQLAELKKALVKAGVDPKDFEAGLDGSPPRIDLETAWTIFRPVRHNPRDLEVALREAGKVRIWQVHVPALYEALTGHYHAPTNNLLLRLLMAGRDLARAGFTLGLDFSIGSNLTRDQFTAAVQSRYGYKPLHVNPLKPGDFFKSDFWLGLWQVMRRSETYQLFLQAKAGSAGKVGTYADHLEATIRDLDKGRTRRILEKAIRPLYLLEIVTAASDNATRVGEFARALDVEGVSAEGLARAGLAARDVTVDFNRGGQWSREIGQWRAFFGAAMQGPDVLARNFKNRPWELITRSLLGVTALSLVLHFLARDNPDYQERKKERELYWLIPLGNPRSTQRWLRLRKPHELGAIFGNVGEAIAEALWTGDARELRQWIPDTTTGFEILMDLLPTAVVPLIEAGMNYDAFRQRPIVPDYAKDLEPELQYNRYTSESAKLLGRWLKLSPAKIDHVLYGYTGTLGDAVVQTLDDQVLNRVRGIVPSDGNAPSAPPSRGGWEQAVPGLRKFFSKDLSAHSAQSLLELYGLIDRLRTVERSLSLYSGNEREAYEKSNRAILQRKGELKAAEQRLMGLRDAMERVFADSQLSAEAKRLQLGTLTMEMVNVARDVLRKPPLPAPVNNR